MRRMFYKRDMSTRKGLKGGPPCHHYNIHHVDPPLCPCYGVGWIPSGSRRKAASMSQADLYTSTPKLQAWSLFFVRFLSKCRYACGTSPGVLIGLGPQKCVAPTPCAPGSRVLAGGEHMAALPCPPDCAFFQVQKWGVWEISDEGVEGASQGCHLILCPRLVEEKWHVLRLPHPNSTLF